MDLRVLNYFTAIVETGSFGKAAEQVHISQPALSKAIKLLEDELSVILLERGKRGSQIKLTPAGSLVYQHAQTLLDNKHKMLTELKMLKRLEYGHLKIGLSPLGSAELFAPIIAKFRANYPQIEIELLERGGAAQENALRNSEIELAMSLIPDDQDFEWLQVCNDPMMVALPNSHPLTQLQELSLLDLADVALVTYEESFMLHKVILSEYDKTGIKPKEITNVSQTDFGLALVAAGAGVMLLPKLIAERHITQGVTLKPLKSSSLRWQLCVIWRKKAVLSFAAEAILGLIKAKFST
ncbi:LysR family transcriptional regulator [Catenovulum sp. 2E275]|uniref:LysR family transcriptional regulator n=1 Tax=Catenovulum sp. 2E275 TaxID=2980497 RepID=UPI0021D24904|nr:LysR family transcriptional regulator [Catenovulum sp. 2E275]MCU4675071.1 LysR family transcriptional regulator [Catenovulum sp. 2E275]